MKNNRYLEESELAVHHNCSENSKSLSKKLFPILRLLDNDSILRIVGGN